MRNFKQPPASAFFVRPQGAALMLGLGKGVNLIP